MNTIDADDITQQAEQVDLMLRGSAWEFIKSKLDLKILDLQNINNIDPGSGVSLETQLLGRKLASDLLYAWLKQDVYGIVEQANANELKRRVEPEGFIEVSPEG